jgi:hypothetical protein
MVRKGRDDEFTLRQIRRAHDVLEGCLVSLSVSESARGTLLDQLRILYEFSMYPIVVPSADTRAIFSRSRESKGVSDASDTGESGEAAEAELTGEEIDRSMGLARQIRDER